MTLACAGLADHWEDLCARGPDEHRAVCRAWLRHDWCQGFAFRLVPGQVEYAVEDCRCACHRRL